MSLATVSNRLGHSTTRTTADIYGHFVPELDRDAAEKVASLFG